MKTRDRTSPRKWRDWRLAQLRRRAEAKQIRRAALKLWGDPSPFLAAGRILGTKRKP